MRMGNSTLHVEIAPSRKRENFITSIDELLGNARGVQEVAVHVDSNTIGKTRQKEGKVGER